MCTRTIATGGGRYHWYSSADCPPAFPQPGNPVPLGLWCCAVSSPVAAHGLTRTYIHAHLVLTAYVRRLHSTSPSPPYTHSLVPWPICSGRPRSPPPRPSLGPGALAPSAPDRPRLPAVARSPPINLPHLRRLVATSSGSQCHRWRWPAAPPPTEPPRGDVGAPTRPTRKT